MIYRNQYPVQKATEEAAQLVLFPLTSFGGSVDLHVHSLLGRIFGPFHHVKVR